MAEINGATSVQDVTLGIVPEGGVASNLQLTELIPLAAAAFIPYRLNERRADKVQFIGALVAGALLANSALGNQNFFSGESGKFAFGNFQIQELAISAFYGYIAYDNLKGSRDTLLGAVSAALAASVLLKGGFGPKFL